MPSVPSAVVVKVGGSLADSGRLAGILAIIAKATVPVVVVPGGGPFADAVRDIQARFGLDDALCHRLALLSMHQMGLVIAAADPTFEPAGTPDEIVDVIGRGAIPVWMPYEMAAADPDLPADWTVTSDALAAFLAERIGALDVVLVKSCSVEPSLSLDALAKARIVDPVFGSIALRAGLSWAVFGAGGEQFLSQRLVSSA